MLGGQEIVDLDPDNVERDVRDIELCRRVLEVLCRHYPNYPWNCYADSSPKSNYITIRAQFPDKLGLLPKEGYLLFIDTLTDEKIMRAGGELLERYNLHRGKASPYAFADAIRNGLDRTGA